MLSTIFGGTIPRSTAGGSCFAAGSAAGMGDRGGALRRAPPPRARQQLLARRVGARAAAADGLSHSDCHKCSGAVAGVYGGRHSLWSCLSCASRRLTEAYRTSLGLAPDTHHICRRPRLEMPARGPADPDRRSRQARRGGCASRAPPSGDPPMTSPKLGVLTPQNSQIIFAARATTAFARFQLTRREIFAGTACLAASSLLPAPAFAQNPTSNDRSKGVPDMSSGLHQDQRRRPDLLQGLGSEGRPAHRLPSRLAASARRLGQPDAVLPEQRLPRRRA